MCRIPTVGSPLKSSVSLSSIAYRAASLHIETISAPEKPPLKSSFANLSI